MKFIGCEKLKPHSPTIEIVSNSQTFDLHNAGEFLGFNYIVKLRSLDLDWNYYEPVGHPIDKYVRIECKEVLSFRVKERDNEMPFSEDDCLSEIIFNDKDESITFAFMGGQEINVNCKELRFNLVDK